MVEMEGKMVKVFGVLAISIWLILLLLEPSIAASDSFILSFDVGNDPTIPETYSQLLDRIRKNVKDPTLKYGLTDIPVMAEKPIMAEKPTTSFLLVELKASEGKTITIGISKEEKYNLYVEGYLDKVKNTKTKKDIFRSHIFSDASDFAKKNLFPEATGADRVVIPYSSAYADIEKKAGLISRNKLPLSVPQLNKFIKKVYGEPLHVQTEAQFLLIVIQMLAEATRFKYIENRILENLNTYTYMPDDKMMKLELNWQTISKRIKSSRNGVISPVLDLTYDRNKPWKVSKVSEIAPDMGLLKYEPQASYLLSFIRLNKAAIM